MLDLRSASGSTVISSIKTCNRQVWKEQKNNSTLNTLCNMYKLLYFLRHFILIATCQIIYCDITSFKFWISNRHKICIDHFRWEKVVVNFFYLFHTLFKVRNTVVSIPSRNIKKRYEQDVLISELHPESFCVSNVIIHTRVCEQPKWLFSFCYCYRNTSTCVSQRQYDVFALGFERS